METTPYSTLTKAFKPVFATKELLEAALKGAMPYPAWGGSGRPQHVGHGGSHKLVRLVVGRLMRQLGQHPFPGPQQPSLAPQTCHRTKSSTTLNSSGLQGGRDVQSELARPVTAAIGCCSVT